MIQIIPTGDPKEIANRFIQIAERLPEGYKVTSEIEDILFCLSLYFANDPEFENVDIPQLRTKPNLRKGIYIQGNPGSGKTTIMKILSKIGNFHFIPCDIVADNVRREGQKAVDDIHNKIMDSIYFDDLGSEQKIKHFGNTMDVMHDIVIKRYRNFVQNGIKTHFSTNLSMTEIGKLYDARIESRLYEMCNVIVLGGGKDYKDFRK